MGDVTGNFAVYANSCNIHTSGSLISVVGRFNPHVCFARLHSAVHRSGPGAFRRTTRLGNSISVCRIIGTVIRRRRHHGTRNGRSLVPVHPSRNRRVLSSLGGGAGPNCSTVNHLGNLTRIHNIRLTVRHTFFDHWCPPT